MVVTNFDGTLDVGVAFQLLIHNLPVRRGIVVSVDSTTKEPHVWYENKSVKRERGDSHVFIGIFEGFSNEDIPKLTITPVPCRFDSWLSRVPAQVRIACGSIRARPMTSQLAQVRVALDMMNNKLDVILHKLEKLEKE